MPRPVDTRSTAPSVMLLRVKPGLDPRKFHLAMAIPLGAIALRMLGGAVILANGGFSFVQSAEALMDVGRKIFVGLAWLFVLAVAIQFFLAGLGVLGGESVEAHRQWGFIVLHLMPILMLIAAIVGRMGRTVLALTAVLFLLVFVQPLFVDPEFDPRWLRSLHVLNALFIFALGYRLAQRGTETVRGMKVAA